MHHKRLNGFGSIFYIPLSDRSWGSLEGEIEGWALYVCLCRISYYKRHYSTLTNHEVLQCCTSCWVGIPSSFTNHIRPEHLRSSTTPTETGFRVHVSREHWLPAWTVMWKNCSALAVFQARTSRTASTQICEDGICLASRIVHRCPRSGTPAVVHLGAVCQ